MNPRGGGPSEGIRRMDAELVTQGHSCETLCMDLQDDVDEFQKSYAGRLITLGPGLAGYAYQSRLVPWLKSHAGRYDVVIVHGLWQYHALAAWRALAGGDVPYFVLVHGMLDPWFKRTYPLKHIKKWVYWLLAEHRVLRDAHRVIFTSEEERLLARQSFRRYEVSEAVTGYGTAPPPSDGDRLVKVFLESYPELRGKRLVLFLSRIHEKKGCDLLIEAFAKVAELDDHLHLVMAGPDQSGWVAELKAQVSARGIANHVTWPGMLYGEMKLGAFYAAEVFALPSHQENFGIVVAEALSCGKPVLISNQVNIWREIEAHHAGFVASDNFEGTLHNLQRWLALDKKDVEQMGQNAKNCFAEHFHIYTAARRFLEIIQQ
jgi:glycosyltransferase involved in cell wall biosynthesis